ncbi:MULTISPECIES: hypothetical protein [Massilia]|jgi:hypothetical protein|uniref:hypothetical protein n=1 Tax=Massilia TaxID=149698 RepID=UPI001C628BDD|nr:MULTISPECIES: hypothetical protein [Massilia]QYG03965.1 hypothetical protein KY496_11595 [Massilia sp. NP310]
MNDNSASVHSLIATLSLGSHSILKSLKRISLQRPFLEVELREATYLSYLSWEARLPDHVFESAWRRIIESEEKPGKAHSNWCRLALTSLAHEFIEQKHGRQILKISKFNKWQQGILSRMSGLPIQSAAEACFSFPGNVQGKSSLDSAPLYSPLISPEDALVEDYINHEGLNETHLHLNGSTHAEICWLRALIDPQRETRDFNKQWNNIANPNSSKIKELAKSINPDLNPSELYNQLIVARNARLWLIEFARNNISANAILPRSYTCLLNNIPPAPLSTNGGKIKSDALRISEEKSWMTEVIRRLGNTVSTTADRLLHIYLLIQSQYYRLLVQNEEQSGFDQFQKLTFTDLREPAEQQYFFRFMAMHGSNTGKSRINYLEGRFAPKSSLKKNYELVYSILSGYLNYLYSATTGYSCNNSSKSLTLLLDRLEQFFLSSQPNITRHQRLALVSHFIKQPWSHENSSKSGPYRFYSLRRDLEAKSNTLLLMFSHWPKLHNWIRGIDAAANELHAPPEVFASCYRVLQRAGITRRSYHVGEDFPHILTGITQILEAVEFLDLREGDRIGHGTAMGISPQLWIDRMPSRLFIKAGEWMLTLLATWRLLRRLPDAVAEAYKVECDLADTASHIFGLDISCSRLARSMELRILNIRYLMDSADPDWNWRNASTSDIWREEARLVADARLHRTDDLEYLNMWLTDPGLWARSEAMIPVDTGYLSPNVYVRVQQALMEEIKVRKVVVETLPSSNVRISLYNSFKEHHSLRWMRVPGHLKDGDPEIMVSLGSDDPGIFAGDLNSEFYQLYATLREIGLGDKSAMQYLTPINERGRQYRFHHPLLR